MSIRARQVRLASTHGADGRLALSVIRVCLRVSSRRRGLHHTGAAWGIILLNAVVGIAIGLTVFNYVLRTLRSHEASILAASTVIYTAILAVTILGERLALHQIVGIATMLVGISLVQVRRGMLTGRPTNRPTPG